MKSGGSQKMPPLKWPNSREAVRRTAATGAARRASATGDGDHRSAATGEMLRRLIRVIGGCREGFRAQRARLQGQSLGEGRYTLSPVHFRAIKPVNYLYFRLFLTLKGNSCQKLSLIPIVPALPRHALATATAKPAKPTTTGWVRKPPARSGNKVERTCLICFSRNPF